MRHLALFAAALCLGLLPLTGVRAEDPSPVAPGHVAEPAGLYKGAMHGYTPLHVTAGSAAVITLPDLAKAVAAEHPLLLDVAEADRKPPSMSPGMIWAPTHRSIPGAVFLPGAGSGTDDPEFAAAFSTRVAALSGGDKNRLIVVFCHPDCWGSYNAAKRLAGLGYTQVRWFRDGVDGWQAEHDTAVVRPDRTWVASLPKPFTQ